MKQYITPNTIANTVRMGGALNRPKAVFLADNENDIQLARTYLNHKNCRIIPVHTRENAIAAFQILTDSGYAGIMTAVNVGFASDDKDLIKNEVGFDLQGKWEDVVSQASLLAGTTVRVSIVSEDTPEELSSPNVSMLSTLASLREIRSSMTPKQDKEDYLKLGREGAMYGLNDEG